MHRIDEREQLRGRLRDAGHDEGDLDRVAEEGRLASLAVEVALGGAGEHSLTHVARAGGVDPRFLRGLLLAGGRPLPLPRERILTDEDVELAGLARRLLDAGLSRDDLLEITRVLSLGMAQTADAVRRALGEALLRAGDSEEALALRYTQAVDELRPVVQPLLELQLRAHLRAGVRRQLATEHERATGRLEGTETVALAFVDLVDYTRLGERLDAEAVGRIAGRLNELTLSVARRPTRLVKTIGDAVMLVSSEVGPMLDTVLALREAIEGEKGEFPTARSGIAIGPATQRAGDWFGSTVNVASRVADLAKPGRILAVEAVQEAAPDYAWSRKRRRGLKGVDGRVRLFALDGPPSGGDPA